MLWFAIALAFIFVAAIVVGVVAVACDEPKDSVCYPGEPRPRLLIFPKPVPTYQPHKRMRRGGFGTNQPRPVPPNGQTPRHVPGGRVPSNMHRGGGGPQPRLGGRGQQPHPVFF